VPSARFKLVVAAMSALTVGVYLAEPFVIARGQEARPAAADFTIATVDGSTFSLTQRPNGSLAVIDFMATWCIPCRRQLLDLAELRAEFTPAELTIVSVDEEYGIDPQRIADFRLAFANIAESREGVGWYFAVDTVEAHVGLEYRITALPAVVLVDAAGRIAATWIGGVASSTLASAIAGELAA
jgi:thiol-disulfide isomerase/thioredoxin